MWGCASAQIRGVAGRTFRAVAAAGFALALAACQTPPPPQAGGSGGGASTGGPAPATQPARVDPNGPVILALLAPTTSSSQAASRAAQDLVAAAQIAMGEMAPPNLVMKVYDTKGTAAGAAEVAGHAVRDGAAVIIGPLLGEATQAAAPVAAQAGLTVYSFSNDAEAAGGNVFLLGQLPGDELRRVLGYAGSQGIGQVAIVHPADRYGEAVAADARAAGRDAGVGVGPIVSYPRSFEGIQGAAQGGASEIRSSGAGAVVIADAGDGLRSMASFLAYYDLSPNVVKYMGLSRWDDPRNASETPLQGGWYAAADPARRAAFGERFRARMAREPSPLAPIGYDAASAAIAMLKAAQAGGPAAFTPAAATARAFEGATGPFRLTPDGLNRRSLAVLEMTPNGPAVLDPAPGAAPGA